jgi:peptidyl-prolyl cis-trans isomerase C
MGCALHTDLAKAARLTVSVNGLIIPHDAISRETQNHAARSPAAAWQAAARALVVRELLLQEANRLELVATPECDDRGRRETTEEAKIRALIEREVVTPEPDAESCRRYYDHNRRKFRSPDIHEAAHILFAASHNDQESFERKRAAAEAVLAVLAREPESFAQLARAHSACPSSEHGGNLGQITPGQTTPEFEKALLGLKPGAMTPVPVETRYGFHIIRLDRRIDGAELPFAMVEQGIAKYLREAASDRAQALYVGMLAGHARIEGLELEPRRSQSAGGQLS